MPPLAVLLEVPITDPAPTHEFPEILGGTSRPPIRVHDLRHTRATMPLSRGVHPKIVQELLGHSQISLTIDTSSHVLPTMQEEAARVMELALAARCKILSRIGAGLAQKAEHGR